MAGVVTDPELIARLEASARKPMRPVTDPELIARLEAGAVPPEGRPSETNEAREGFSFIDMLSNIPGSAARYGGNIVSTIAHPIRTGKAIGGLAQALGNKLGRNVAEIVQGEDLEPIPERSEEMADVVGQAFKERYGSGEAIKRTLQEDPVGALADVAGVAMAVPGAARVGAALEPLNIAAKGTRAAGKALVPKGLPSKLYQSAAKFSTTLKPAKRSAIIQTALEEGIMPTARGVRKVQDRIDILDNTLDDLITEATNANVKIPVKAVYMYLGDLRRTKGGVRLGAQSDLKAIDQIAAEFDKHMKALGKSSLTPAELQRFKTDAYKQINWDAKRLTGTPIKEETFKAMARAAKDAIAKEVPEVSEVNRRMGGLLELQPHLTRSANRIGNRNLLSINAPLNVSAGGIVGSAADATGLGAGIGLAGAALGNPKVKAGLALALHKISEGDVGWLQNNINRAEVRIALSLLGRATSDESAGSPGPTNP